MMHAHGRLLDSGSTATEETSPLNGAAQQAALERELLRPHHVGFRV